MSNHQYSHSYVNHTRSSTMRKVQPSDPDAGLVVTAGPEHDGRSSSSGSPPSSGTSSSLYTYAGGATFSTASSNSQTRRSSSSGMSQEQVYGYDSTAGFHNNKPPARAAQHESHHTTRRTSNFGSQSFTMIHGYQARQGPTLAGVPEAVSVQEMAFRQGQRDSGTRANDISASPFARQYDELWATFYKMGKEYSDQRAPTPVDASLQNFAWPVLINPYTQSLKRPNGSLDPAWSRKMIQVALNCMRELIRVTCRRNNGWEKTVADIPLPAQEALGAFPDLAAQYEQLTRDAEEARAGGRPYGY